MSELSPLDESAAAQPFPEWPSGSHAEVADHLVQRSLAPLNALPGTPVAEHEAIYNELHDHLRAALDADPSVTDGSSAASRDGAA
ncbi:conserved hypothetical protein [Arthrobacter sp. 9AX]|uniref:hypothetical protein n=1 Tax=Arthrobacter sp. 9AX TaxID=2653131 RepID=UPI0012EF5028|nr:hypothetical protein [Arthrobacter sp. 9AX]VXB10017.1 conserved hypothetical protein [Arthrobacter sp. 9AX]